EADDHQPHGWLKQTSSTFEFFTGDGTRYTWDDTSFTSRKLFYQHLDEAGNLIAQATPDASERPTKIESANSSIYYSLTYGASGLDSVRISSTSAVPQVNQILDYDVGDYGGGVLLLDKVKFASSVNTIDADTFVAYAYNATSRNLETVTQKID